MGGSSTFALAVGQWTGQGSPKEAGRMYRSTQPCIPLGSLNRVPALIGWGKGRNVTYAGWQVILCDPIWHVSSRSGAVLVAQTTISFAALPYRLALRARSGCSRLRRSQPCFIELSANDPGMYSVPGFFSLYSCSHACEISHQCVARWLQ